MHQIFPKACKKERCLEHSAFNSTVFVSKVHDANEGRSWELGQQAERERETDWWTNRRTHSNEPQIHLALRRYATLWCAHACVRVFKGAWQMEGLRKPQKYVWKDAIPVEACPPLPYHLLFPPFTPFAHFQLLVHSTIFSPLVFSFIYHLFLLSPSPRSLWPCARLPSAIVIQVGFRFSNVSRIKLHLCSLRVSHCHGVFFLYCLLSYIKLLQHTCVHRFRDVEHVLWTEKAFCMLACSFTSCPWVNITQNQTTDRNIVCCLAMGTFFLIWCIADEYRIIIGHPQLGDPVGVNPSELVSK